MSGDLKDPVATLRETLTVLLRNPWVAALMTGFLVTLVFYLVSRETQVPVFAVSEPELLARSFGRDGGLTVLWDGEEVENVVSVKVVIWNEGNRFIRGSDFSETDPIRIVPSQKVDILSVEIPSRSRKGLSFYTRVERDEDDRQSVVLHLAGDEALEASDGAVFNILYAGSEDCSWQVTGRVLGVPEGFQSKGKIPTAAFPKEVLWLANITMITTGALALVFIRFRQLHDLPAQWLLLLVPLGLANLVIFLIVYCFRSALYPVWYNW